MVHKDNTDNFDVRKNNQKLPMLKRMKILVVHEIFGRLGGAEQYIYNFASILHNTHELSYLYWREAVNLTDDFRESFAETYQVDFSGEQLQLKHDITSILKIDSPNFIFIHKCQSIHLLDSIFCSGIPVVRYFHDHDTYCMRSYRYHPLTRKICEKKAGLRCIFPCGAIVKRDRSKGKFGIKIASFSEQMNQIKIYKRCHAYFVPSRFMRTELIRQGFDEEKIYISPPSPPMGRANIQSTFSDDNMVIFTGQIIRGKGVDCLLKAMSKVQIDFKLLIFGQGSFFDKITALCSQLNLADRVDFKGFVSQKTISAYMQQASMAVVPSVWPEPGGTSGLESMMHGLPVVGFDAGAIREWLINNETGFLVPWMDIELMAQKIEYLLSHKDIAAEMGRKAQNYFREKYNIRRDVNEMINIFNGLLSKQ